MTISGTPVAAPTTLVGLDRLKDGLQIARTNDDYNTVLNDINAAVSGRISKMCSRRFIAEDYRELVWVNESQYVIVDNAPVIMIEKVGHGLERLFSVENDTALRAMVIVETDQVRCRTTSTAGAVTNSTFAFTTYPLVSDIVDGINALTGYTATLITDAPSNELWPRAGVNCTARRVDIDGVDSDSFDIEYDVEPDVGGIAFYNIPFRNALVWYRAGFEQIPDDLQQCAIAIARISFNMIGKDPTTTSVTTAKLESTVTRSITNLEADISKTINRYKFIRVAKEVAGRGGGYQGIWR